MEENKNGKIYCSACKNEISENFNFCPNCGRPLTELAKRLVTEQKINCELELLIKLIDYVEDDKTLKLLNALIKKLGNQ